VLHTRSSNWGVPPLVRGQTVRKRG
jgi:hypothetical protein